MVGRIEGGERKIKGVSERGGGGGEVSARAIFGRHVGGGGRRQLWVFRRRRVCGPTVASSAALIRTNGVDRMYVCVCLFDASAAHDGALDTRTLKRH